MNQILKAGTDALDKIGIDYVVVGGTLLGIYRDGHLMPFDYDIDVAVLAEDVGDTKEFLGKLSEAVGKENVEKVIFRDNYFTAYYQYSSPKTIAFDVFMMFKRGNKRYAHFFNKGENPRTEKCLIWPEKHYKKKDWGQVKYEDKWYKIPADTVGWMEKFFGKDWVTPIPSWRWGLAGNCHIFGEYNKWEN
jgi:hypothetical protein